MKYHTASWTIVVFAGVSVEIHVTGSDSQTPAASARTVAKAAAVLKECANAIERIKTTYNTPVTS